MQKSIIEVSCPASSGSATLVDLRVRLAPQQHVRRGDVLTEQGTDAYSGSVTAATSSLHQRMPDHRGRITVLRPPTVEIDRTPTPFSFDPAVDPEPDQPAALPWGAAIPSMLTGAVAGLVFSPLFALLSVASAVVLLGRGVAQRIGARRCRRRRIRQIASARDRIAPIVETWLRVEAERQRSLPFEPAELSDALRSGRSPWTARLRRDEPLSLVLGRCDAQVEHPEPEVAGLLSLALTRTLPDVPLRLDLASGRGLALLGERRQALDAVRWLVASQTYMFGPADLGLIVLTTADRLGEWDWLKWLPHLDAALVLEHGGREVDEVRWKRLAKVLTASRAEAPRPVLVIVDGPEPEGPGALAELLSGRLDGARTLWLGTSADRVPAVCSGLFQLRADGSCRSTSVPGGPTVAGRFHRHTLSQALELARWLAPLDDPDHQVVDHRMPQAVSLAELLPSPDGHGVATVWGGGDRRSLHCPLGVDERGPVGIDLVKDGPHALVAGTTGAGKSELLRTLVASAALESGPELLSFLLIDFKGGGAFDAVQGLPHVAAVVTDLDAGEAGRALRSLRAELRSREHRLRAAGVSDVADLPLGSGEPMPRLVVMVDEFAVLADELPDFLDGLVDIARLGRSLGVHLVLATQRPAGVVTGQIRANTNLRICLRVQDAADSTDVLGRADAANLPRIPGRALMQRGDGALQPVQVAHLGGGGGSTLVDAFTVHPALDGAHPVDLASLGSLGLESASDEAVDTMQTISGACRMAAKGLVLPCPPWLDQLGPLTLSDLTTSPERRTAILGLADDPDRRCQPPVEWNMAEDGLLILGAETAAVESSVATAVCAVLTSTGREAPEVVVLDGGAGAWSRALLDLPSVGDVVGLRDPKRLERALHLLQSRPVDAAPLLLVVHRWSAVVDALADVLGMDAPMALTRIVRDLVAGPGSVIVSGASDRDVPGRVATQLSQRLIHRLADPASYLTFGLRPGEVPTLLERQAVVLGGGTDGLLASVATVTPAELAALGQAQRRLGAAAPAPIKVLGRSVARTSLPPVQPDRDRHLVPLGLDHELAPCLVALSRRRPLLVVGHPGTGRSTALATATLLLQEQGCGTEVLVLDDTEDQSVADIEQALATAADQGHMVLASCSPSALRAFGSWAAKLAADAAVVLLNPTRADGELCRVLVPDLSDEPVGRAAVVDRGRVSVVQIAA